jgi:beta-xylosidase
LRRNTEGTWHDETAQPAFIAAAVDAVSTIVPPPEMFAYWAISDVFTEMGLPADSVAFHGGFGLISLHGARFFGQNFPLEECHWISPILLRLEALPCM